jgi:hypothetical protein
MPGLSKKSLDSPIHEVPIIPLANNNGLGSTRFL